MIYLHPIDRCRSCGDLCHPVGGDGPTASWCAPCDAAPRGRYLYARAASPASDRRGSGHVVWAPEQRVGCESGPGPWDDLLSPAPAPGGDI